MTTTEKLKEFATAQKEVLIPQGYNLWSCFTQAYHETAGFAKVIGNHNYWGIKRPSGWAGKSYSLFTREWEIVLPGDNEALARARCQLKYGESNVAIQSVSNDGKHWIISLPQYFIDFDTVADALKWWSGLIQRKYQQAYEQRGNPAEFFKGLINGKFQWATDAEYARKLIDLYQSLIFRRDIGDVVEIAQQHGNTY